MTWNPYLVARRALRFKRGQRKCSCIGGQILPTRINNNHWKLIYVSRTIPSSQYETNLWSTHVNIVRLTEPIRRCVRWRTQVFKIEGFVCKRFLPSPPPPPTFIFWLLFHFSRGQNRESRSSVFLYSETKRKRLLRRLVPKRTHLFQTHLRGAEGEGSGVLKKERWLILRREIVQPRVKNIGTSSWWINHLGSVHTKFYSDDWLMQSIILWVTNNKGERGLKERAVINFLPRKGRGAY